MSFIIIIGISLFFIWSGKKESEKIRTVDEYLLGSKSIGIATGTAVVLVYWITGNTLLAAPEAVYNFGILGSIGYALTGSIGLIMFALIASRIKQQDTTIKSIGDFFYLKYKSLRLKRLLLLITFLHLLGIASTQGIGAGTLLTHAFHLPYSVSVAIVFIIATLSILFGGFTSIIRIGLIQVMIILSIALIIPAFLFLKMGAVNVYTDLTILSPEHLDIGNQEGQLFLLSGLFLGMGAVLMDQFFWQRNYVFNKQVVVSSFLNSSIIWFFIPLGFGSLAFIALISSGNRSEITSFIPLFVELTGGPFIRPFLLVAIWCALLSTLGIVLNSLVSLLTYYVFEGNKSVKTVRMTVLGISCVGFVICLFPHQSMLELLLLFAVINCAVIFPTLASMVPFQIPVLYVYSAIILASLSGLFTNFTVGSTHGILVSVVISFLITLVGSAVALFKKVSLNSS